MNTLAAALYSTLTGGTALTALLAGTTSIYHLQAPDGASLPYIVFNKQAGGPDNLTPSDARTLAYQVRGFAATAKRAGEIDAQVDALITGKALTVTPYTNYYTVRDADIEMVETPQNGAPIFSAGAIYRIRIDK
jgi:hypothetical protein